MNILLTESQIRVIISEDKKNRALDVLTKKIGLSEEFANDFIGVCGSLSVIMFNKMLPIYTQKYIDTVGNKDLIIGYINRRPQSFYGVVGSRQVLVSIMDWIRVGLNGDFKQYQNLSINDLYHKSKEWHDSLGVGESKFDYKEKTDNIILDFRDENGYGYYWVDLKTTRCTDEQERMGHCASSKGSLYSFREYKPVPGGKHTLNKSLLTASITDDGNLLQLKGPKNSKPDSKYNPYILPLFKLKIGDEYLINSTGSEYDSKNDFKLVELPDEQFVNLYQERPELFTGRAEKKILYSLGILVRPERDSIFMLTMRPKDIDDYVDGGWIVRRGTTKDGRTYSSDIFETILEGDLWDIYDNYEADWKGAVTYYLDKENTQKIQTILTKFTQERGEQIDFSESLEDLIEEYDDNHDITSAISDSVNDAERDSYHNYLYQQLRECFEHYGKVIKMDYTGVEIEVDLDKHIDDVDEEEIDDAYERCNDNISCVFAELLSENWIDKPKFHIDDRWYPDVDKNNFNSILNDRLSEI